MHAENEVDTTNAVIGFVIALFLVYIFCMLTLLEL